MVTPDRYLDRVVNDPDVVTALLEVINDRYDIAYKKAVRKALETVNGDEGARVPALLSQGAAEALKELYKTIDERRKVAIK